MKPQTAEIFEHLKLYGSLTAQQALREYGCFRLAARVEELRDAGHPIETALVVEGKKRFARYWLSNGANAGSEK